MIRDELNIAISFQANLTVDKKDGAKSSESRGTVRMTNARNVRWMKREINGIQTNRKVGN